MNTPRHSVVVALVAGILLGPAAAGAQTEQPVAHTIVTDVTSPPDPVQIRTWRNPVDLASTQAELDQLWLDFAFAYVGGGLSSDPPDAWRSVPPPPVNLDTHVAIGCVCDVVPEGLSTDGRGRLFVNVSPPGMNGGNTGISTRRILLTVPRHALPGQSFQLIYREDDKTWPVVSITVTGPAGPELAATGPPPLATAAIALLLTGAAMVVLARPRCGRP